MKKQQSRVLLLAAGMLLLHTAPTAVSAANSGTLPPPKVQSNSHAPISMLDFQDIAWPNAVAAGSDLVLRFSVVNNGKGAAKNIHIRAESQDLNGLVPRSKSNVNAKYYAPKQKESYEFNFRLTENAEKKNYPIKLSISYVDTNTGEVLNSQQMVTITSTGHIVDGANLGANPSSLGDMTSTIPAASSDMSSMSGGFSGGDLGPSLPITGSGASGEGQAATGANTPKIVIDQYTLDPQTVIAGEPFNLYFRIFNTNRNKTIKNIRVSLSAEAAEAMEMPTKSEGTSAAAAMASASGGGSAFIPVGSSNTFHIEKIKPRQAKEKEITLTTAPDTAAKTYTLTATFEYEDNNGNPYTSSEVIGIPVIQSSELQPGDLKVEKTGFVGEEMPLSFEFFNTGKSVLSNVMVKLRGNFDTDTNTYFAGNIAPSSAETYDVNITPKEKGEQKGEVVITYDDATGKRQELVKPFSIQVEDSMAEVETEVESARPKWAIPLGLGIIAIVAGAIAFYVIKKRKAKAKDDEDLTL